MAMVMVLMPLSGLIGKVHAAPLTNIVVTPAALTVSTATNVTVTFTPNTAITTGTIIEYTYSTSFTGGAALTDADIAITGTNITGKVCSGFVAGYFTCTLTTSASVTTLVTTVIGGANQLTTPSSAGNYSWSVSANIGGLGSTYDTGAGLAYIAGENQVLITAVVPPVLALDLYQAGTNTLLTNPNTCALGVLSINSVNTCAYDVGIGTNDTAGATAKVRAGAGLTNGSHTFVNATGAITAGTEAYGFYVSANGTAFTPAGSYGTAYQTVPTTETTFATSAVKSDKTTTAQHFTVTHAATMSSSTDTGSYTQTVFWTVYTN